LILLFLLVVKIKNRERIDARKRSVKGSSETRQGAQNKEILVDAEVVQKNL
jgi:hypothetical protein